MPDFRPFRSLPWLVLSVAQAVGAQCEPQWLTAGGPPNDSVYAVAAWDPDGPGPLGERYVVGGDFTQVGTAIATRVAAFDPVTGTWSALGAGCSARVRTLLALPDGGLVAGGDFLFAGGTAVRGIARWDGTTWQPLGSGVANGTLPAYVYDLALYGGDLVAVGFFQSAGGVPAANVARWDGLAWSAFGGGVNGSVNAVAAAADGSLWVGGSFSQAGGGPANHVARWDGSAWSALGAGIPDTVADLRLRRDGAMVAVSVARITTWTGAAWQPLGQTAALYTERIVELPDGDLCALGFGSWNGQFGHHVIRWNGGAWNSIGAATAGFATDLACAANGELLLGGAYGFFDGLTAPRFVRRVPACPASAIPLAGGCAHALDASALAWLGGTARTTASGLPQPALAVVVRGLSLPPAPLPLATVLPSALPGCDLVVIPDLLEARVVGAAQVEAELPVPEQPALVGLQVHEQWVVFDGSSAAVPVTSTPALTLTIGVL